MLDGRFGAISPNKAGTYAGKRDGRQEERSEMTGRIIEWSLNTE